MKVPSPTRSSLKSYLMAIIFFFFSQSFCRSCCLPGSSGSGSLTRLQRTSWFSGLFKAIPGREGNGDPLQYSCLENAMDGGAWWAAVHWVVKSRTRLSDFNFTFHFHTLEKAMAIHSSTLAWKIPWTEEPGGLQSMGSRRVRHAWATSLSFFTFLCWRRKWQPTPVLLPGESQGWGEPGGLPSIG